MSFRDLWEVAADPNNEAVAHYVFLTAKCAAVGIAVQRLFNPPAVREHGQERRYREKPHAAVEVSSVA